MLHEARAVVVDVVDVHDHRGDGAAYGGPPGRGGDHLEADLCGGWARVVVEASVQVDLSCSHGHASTQISDPN